MRLIVKRYAALCGIFILALYVSCCEARPVFATLTETQQHAESIQEWVESENNNWLNPTFSSYHKSLNPGVTRRFFNWFGMGRKAWNAQGFKKLLLSLIKQRELQGWMGDFVQKYQVKAGDRVFIWTDLFGAFHSLIRDLVELKSKGIISDELKIIDQNHIFVFNGNVISHSPYSLETLTFVMRLLEVNPQQVIYVRGSLEEKQEWHSYGLARELKIRGSQLSREMIPMNGAMTQFFNTLPLGLFLPEVSEKEINVVLLVNNEHTKSGFDTKRMAGFLAKQDTERLSSFKLANKSTSDKKVQVKALISGEDRSITYHKTDGLTMLGMQREALQWIVFSSPTSRNRRLYEFFYDAFAEIAVMDQLDDWTITLYNRDVRKLSGFQKVATYDLLTGQKAGVRLKPKRRVEKKETEEKKEAKELLKEPDPKKKVKEDTDKQEAQPGVETEEVVLGSTIDLSKSASMIGKPVKEGLDMAFQKVMQEGGVGSFLPRIIIYDDEYTPSKTRKLVADFINKSNIDIFLNSTGSPTTEVYLDLIKDGKALVLFPYTGAPIFRKPELKYMAHMRVGYVDEGKALAEYAIDKMGARKIVIFYQNDAFGRGALQGAMEVIEKKGLKDVVKVPYERNDVQFDPQAKIIEQTDPDTIFFFAVTPSARSLIRQMGVSFFRGRNLIGMSVYDESFERFLEAKGLRFVMVRVVPNPKTSDLEIVREYRDAAKETNHVLNFNSLEAFINASIFFEILKRIKPPLTKEKIIKEIESIKNYNFKGIELDFDPNSRELVRTLWLDTGDGPLIKKEVRPASNELKTAEKELPQSKAKEETEQIPEKKKETKIAQIGDTQPLTFGATMDLSKSASPIGKKVREGLRLRFDQARQKGELPNLSPNLVTQDDEYTPKKTRKEVERFIKDLGITMVVGSQGSASLESYLDLIRDGKILVMFPFTGAPIFRKPDLKNLIHFRGSYVREGEELVKYALDKRKAKKIAIFYQDDAFGKGPLEGARRALKEAGITDFVEVPHARNDVNFKRHAAMIKEQDPDTILFATNAIPIRGLIRQMGVDFFSGKTLLGVSVYEDAFEQFLKDKGLSFVLIRMVPDPKTSELEIAREYRAAADAAGVPYDKVSFEMYINGSILFDFLKRIKGPITKEKIIEIAQQTKNYSFKGLTLDFNEETRELSPVLWLDTGRGEWLEKSKKEEGSKKEKEAEPIKELKAELPAKEPKKDLANGGERKPFLIGSTIDLSKGVKQQGIAVKHGIELRLKEAAEVDDDQSIGRVFIVDDEYTSIKTRQEVESFLERGIDTMLAPVGSPTLESYLDLVKEGKVLVLFPITGAPLFRSPDLKYIVHIRPSYKIEGKILAEYALDTAKTKKGAMFYQDDAFGQGLLDGARDVLKDRGVTGWIEVPYQRNDVNFKKQVARIKKYDPDTILFFSTTTAASGLIRHLGIQEVSSKKILANSDFGEEQFLNFVKEKGLKLIYLNVVPNPLKSSMAIVEQFRNAAQKYDVSLDTFSLEAYIATDFLLDVLHKIEGEITKKKIIDAIEHIKNYDYKGLRFNFDPETRTLSSTFWMNAGGADWQVITVKP